MRCFYYVFCAEVVWPSSDGADRHGIWISTIQIDIFYLKQSAHLNVVYFMYWCSFDYMSDVCMTCV